MAHPTKIQKSKEDHDLYEVPNPVNRQGNRSSTETLSPRIRDPRLALPQINIPSSLAHLKDGPDGREFGITR